MYNVAMNEEGAKFFRQIIRHSLTHDHFHEIYYDHLPYKREIAISCVCGKDWILPDLKFRDFDMETTELFRLIGDFNNPEHYNLMKERGTVGKIQKEEMLERTQSPTIAGLEL